MSAKEASVSGQLGGFRHGGSLSGRLWRRRRTGIKATALGTVMGLIASMVGLITAPPALAADSGISALAATLTELETWTQGLGSLDKLADSLPAVQASPGAVVGFANLLQEYFDDADGHEALSAADTDSDFNFTDRAIEISDDRAGTMSAALATLGNGDKQLDLTLTVARIVGDQALNIPLPIGSNSNAPLSAFSSHGGVDLTVTATLSFRLVWEANVDKVHLVADATTPSFEVGATAELGTLADITAAIGILGVSVVAPSALTLSANFKAIVSDPNNDGRLAFEETDGSAGELAQDGSLDGLVEFGFASPAGSLAANLTLNAAPTNATLTLPAISAGISVDWPDISIGAPDINATGIEAAGKFLNMTPRDIADGLGQLVTSLTSIQKSSVGNLDLPFVKGTLADAVKVGEIVAEFLDDNTIAAKDDPASGGNPTFVSLQELFDRFEAATFDVVPGATISVSAINYSDTDSKLDFTLTLTRAPTSAVDLNAAGAAASGGTGTTYAPTSLTDTNQDWEDGQFAGHHVVAGSSGATILSNTATTLTLDPNGWSPTQPVDGSPYTISGMQGDVGTVQLGDSLKSGGEGVGKANAVNATAKVTPSYRASITLVLDLQPPVIHDPPIEIANPDGSTYIASATPIGADRVLLRTANTNLFHADFPIDAAADIFANAGFLQVRLVGAVHVCQTNAGAECDATPGDDDHMLVVDLKDNGDLTFGEVVSMLLNNPGDLLNFDINVRGFGEVDASVPGTTDFFPGATAHAEFHWNDLTQTAGTDGPQFDVSDLSELADFDFDPANPKALFSIILKTLQTLNSALGDADPSGPAAVFSQEIPLIGRSLRDLLRADESGAGVAVSYGANTLTDSSRSDAKNNSFPTTLVGRSIVAGTQVNIITAVTDTTLTMASNWASQPAAGTPYTVRSELDDAISILETAPSDNLQELVRILDDRLAGTPISFEYQVLDSTPSLIIRLDWERSYHTNAPVQLDFNLPIGDYEVAGVEGSGSVALGTSGHINLGIVVPLQSGDGPPNADALKILDDSSIGVQLDASIEDGHLATTIGPLKLSLGDPDADATEKATAKASYSIELAKSGATGEATTFSDFIGDVDAELNQSSDPVDCGLGGSTDLALCATLPLYISTDGGTTYDKLIDPGNNAFNLRLPKVGTDLADHFDLTGPQIDGHNRLETPDPTELGSAILAHLIDFTQINGVDGYLQLIEQALNAASFGGKLPLIGDDLQQGADFVGKLRATINDALSQLPADGDMGDTQGIRDWVNDQLAQKLSDAGMNPDLVKVDTECSSELTSPAPTVTPTPAGGSNTFTYAVVSYQHNSSGDEEQAMPATGSTNEADFTAAQLGGGNSNALSWDPVDGAEGYKVFREVGGTLQLLADVGAATSYTDDGSDAPDASQNPENSAGPNPKKRDCPYDEFDAVTIRLDVSQGEFDGGGNLTCPDESDPHACIETSVPLDIGIPGLSLRTHDGQGPTVQIGYHLHFAFGISRNDGFFVDTDDEGTVPEFAVGLNFDIPADLEAELAFINITAHNCTDSSEDQALGCGSDAPSAADPLKPLFGGTFSINLQSDDPDGHLTIADLQGAGLDNLFDVKLKAEVAIDWLLKAKVGDDAGFPGIQAELRIGWAWTNAEPGANSGGGVDPLSVSFDNVAIDAGQVFGETLGPIINKIKQVTGPIDPIIKTLYAPIPVLSDLSHLVGGDDVTLVSIAKAFSTIAGGPDLTFVDTVLGVAAFIKDFPECTNTCLIPIGDFALSGDKALNTTATPDNTEGLIDQGTKSLDGAVSGPDGALTALDGKDAKGTGSMTGADSASAKAGFSFPVFENPASLFNVLLGGDVDLVKFDSGPLAIAFDWQQSFGPVYAPPPVFVTMHGSASVTLRIVAGFDTYGIRKAFEKARAGELDLGTIGNAVLQSLFFYTTEDGKPIPVVSFNGEIAAGAEVSAIIIKVGIEGGVGLTVSFLWNDPNNDGKFRISEFLQAALNNPICLFTVSGRLYVFLKAYVTIGFSPFEVSFDFTIVDVTLLDFSATPDCDPPPPKLGGLSDDGTTLVVYAAALGHAAQRGHSSYESDNQDKDTVKITSLHSYDEDPSDGIDPPEFIGVAVDMLGIRREFHNSSIERVVVDGRGYSKPMSVTFIGDAKANDTSKTGPPPPTAQFELDAVVFGGDGNDSIKTGIGTSWVDGGPGDDIIVTGDRTVLNSAGDDYLRPDAAAYVAGGAGKDSINVGNGDDVVAGDSALGYDEVSLPLKELINDDRDAGDPLGADGQDGPTVSVPNWSTITGPDNSEAGTDDSDTLKVGLGHDTAYGNGGPDTISVAPDNPLADVHPEHADLFESQGATLVGGTGDDNFAGGSGDDVIITGPDAGGLDTDPDANGGSDDGSINTVDTGTGNDTVYGSTGVDLVLGHSQPDQVDNIRGGAGEDVLVGGYGEDTIFGGPDDDYVIAEPSEVGDAGPDDGFGPSRTVTKQDLPSGVEPAFKVLVGGTGDDHIIGGDGGAAIDGDGYNPTDRCEAGDPVPSDPVDESVNTPDDGNDKIIGGAGVDNVRAGGGNDYVDAKADNDLVCGEKGDDVLKGGAGNDQVWGGSADDTIYGDAGTDHLFGNEGNDTVYGGDGVDIVEGNNGSDVVFGGTGDDLLVGGTRAPARPDQGDVIYGDTGSDILIGDNGDAGNTDGKNPSGVTVYDLADGNCHTTCTHGGVDTIYGGNANDKAYGGLDDDWVYGGTGDDYIEGNSGADNPFGQAGQDDIIGGSSQFVSGTGLSTDLNTIGVPDTGDTISGGDDQDVIIGDNGFISRPVAGSGSDFTQGRDMTERLVAIYDWANTDPIKYGNDVIHGDDANDVILGEGGDDTVHGDAGDDYIEGNQGSDTISGDEGQDDIIGGSSQVANGADKTGLSAQGMKDTGDALLSGGNVDDVIVGDNGFILRTNTLGDVRRGTLEDTTKGHPGMTPRRINLYDVQDTPAPGTSGDDYITGDTGDDVAFGQSGNDRIKGGDDDDHLEGGQGIDFIEGDAGDDDINGGSLLILSGSGDAAHGLKDAADVLFGGSGDDLIAGDNAAILRVGLALGVPDPDYTTKFTDRLNNAGGLVTLRWFRRLDLRVGGSLLNIPTDRFGDDRISGGTNVDSLFGQDGNDFLSGGPNDDYIEGGGGADVNRGDLPLDIAAPTNVFPPTYPNTADTVVSETATPPALGVTWPGSPGTDGELNGPPAPDGQDDVIGGSSIQGFRDGNDTIEGDGEADFVLGDNGALIRSYGAPDNGGVRHYAVYNKRYPAGGVPANAAVIRYGDPSLGMTSTRFCTAAQATCEPAAAFGNDTLYGDGGDDTAWGQDADDLMRGGAGNDDMYGELGKDTMYGDAGEDAMLGDRGGIVDTYINGTGDDTKFTSYTVSQNQPPAISYTAFRPGTYDRRVDLYHDINGDQFVGASSDPKMPHNGAEEGGDDHMRGGGGHDSMHGGFGDDVMNSDSGGDITFGDRGADVIWGGKGCDPASDDANDYNGSCTDPSSERGTNDKYVDYMFGGKGGTSAASITGALGSDILDWQPRGSYPSNCTSAPWPQTTGNGKNAVTKDPCDWFLMTRTYNDAPGSPYTDASHRDNQTHHGVDWMYGGWDRDIMQADMADEGPNTGDRLLDWSGAYNLYSHCNPSYGGFNDVRQLSPAMLTFLQGWGYGVGLGQVKNDITTAGTSAYEEVAIVYQADLNQHGVGPDFPNTPGHFDAPNACTY